MLGSKFCGRSYNNGPHGCLPVYKYKESERDREERTKSALLFDEQRFADKRTVAEAAEVVKERKLEVVSSVTALSRSRRKNRSCKEAARRLTRSSDPTSTCRLKKTNAFLPPKELTRQVLIFWNVCISAWSLDRNE